MITWAVFAQMQQTGMPWEAGVEKLREVSKGYHRKRAKRESCVSWLAWLAWWRLASLGRLGRFRLPSFRLFIALQKIGVPILLCAQVSLWCNLTTCDSGSPCHLKLTVFLAAVRHRLVGFQHVQCISSSHHSTAHRHASYLIGMHCQPWKQGRVCRQGMLGVNGRSCNKACNAKLGDFRARLGLTLRTQPRDGSPQASWSA